MQRACSWSFFFWPFIMVAAQNIAAATEGVWGESKG